MVFEASLKIRHRRVIDRIVGLHEIGIWLRAASSFESVVLGEKLVTFLFTCGFECGQDVGRGICGARREIIAPAFELLAISLKDTVFEVLTTLARIQ